ncbi:MAG: 5-bromo-4-chloroindolyl phosphate hydrolysis family protein [Pseudomonadota bacterium]
MSAKKFGGAYSPGGSGGASKFRDRKAASVDVRALAMFAFPTPLLLAAFGDLGGDVVRAVSALGLYACLMLGAWLLREGQRAEIAFNAREIAKPPAFPRKIVAACLTGLGVAGAVMLARGEILSAGLSGVLALGCHLAAFGLDPMKSKGVEGTSAADYVIETIDKAEARITETTRLAATIRDRELVSRVESLMGQVRAMLKMVEKDPRDLSRARRYFTVYLKGAEDATRKYAESHAKLNDPALRDEYLGLLADLEGSFGRGQEMLLSDDRTDLEVEIEVLRERLGQEKA